MGERVPGMGITAMLSNQDVGGKGRHQRCKQHLHYFYIRRIFCKWLQWNIHGVATTTAIPQFEHIARPRKKIAPRLMKRDGHDPWIVVKGPLNAIAMMSIKINVEDLGLAGLQHMSNSDRSIVIDAET